MVLCLCAGCTGPRARREFVRQAERLHESSLTPAVLRDDLVAAYLQEVGQRLIEGARAEAPDKASDPLFARLRFHLVNTPDLPNVFTTGGSHVYVYSGLLRSGVCDTEEELAAAMAHAVAHALNLDVQNALGQADPRTPPPGVAWQFVSNRFTAQQEWEADKLAFAIYVRAGYDPELFGNLFQKLSDRYPGRAAVDRAPTWIRPQVALRSTLDLRRIRRRPPVADRRMFADLRRQAQSPAATGQSPADPPADPAAAEEAQIFLWAFPNCILPFDLPRQQQAQELLRPRPPAEPPIEPN